MATEEKISEKYDKLLRQSKTAYAQGVDPTSSDISLQKKKIAAGKKELGEEAEYLKSQWYDDNDEDFGGQKGYLDTVLKTMAAPIYAQVGALEAITGQGSKDGFFSNIAENVKEEGTYGDYLRNLGLPQGVAMPVGLALDVALDPLNAVSLGATAAVPRIMKGISAGSKTGKGIMAGAKVGAKASALTLADKATSFIPTFSKGFTKFEKKVSSRAYDARKEFEDFVGESIIQKVEKMGKRKKLGTKIEEQMRKTKTGTNIVRGGKYSAGDFFRKSIKLENAEKLKKLEDAKNFKGNLFEDSYRNTNSKQADIEFEALAKSKKQSKKLEKLMDDKFEALALRQVGDEESMRKIVNMTKDERISYIKSFDFYDAGEGAEAYNQKLSKILLSSKVRKALGVHGIFSGLYKAAKVPGNILTSGTNSIVGNLLMTGMMGLNVMDRAFASSMKQAFKVATGKSDDAVKAFLAGGHWREVLESFPKLFHQIFGMDPKVIADSGDFINEYAQIAAKKGFKDFNGKKELDELFEKTILRGKEKAKHEQLLKEAADAIASRESNIKKSRSAMGALDTDFETSLLSSEILRGSYADFISGVKKMADEDNTMAKALYFYLTEPLEWYNKFDQTYKLGSAIKMANEGITEQELYRIGKRISLEAADITEIKGKNLFKLSPMKAMEVSNEAYMNYLAMPAYAKIVRGIPFSGQPFFSFSYGMTTLAGKTLANNPGFYNKVQFAMKEISGEKSPLEKKALQGKYNSWLNSPSMLKLPFFNENPFYLNMENMIPYYTMGPLQLSERSYKSRFGNAAAKVIDNSPFFKTPEGQILLDYVFFPMLLNEDEVPQGSFGQPLWKKDATLAEKVGSFAKASVETVLPPSAGILGFLAPQEIAKYAPLYKFAKAANAKAGRNAQGIPNKDAPAERILTTASSMFGLPVKKINLDFVNEDQK